MEQAGGGSRRKVSFGVVDFGTTVEKTGSGKMAAEVKLRWAD
jgi:hypothetical protein